MDESKAYTCNRNQLLEESQREAQDFPGWFAGRSLNGKRTHARAPTIAALREELAPRHLGLCDVVIEKIPACAAEMLDVPRSAASHGSAGATD
jgi:hypothetical protein